jgi:hypothetical protein
MRNPTVKEAKLSLRRQESTRDATRLEEAYVNNVKKKGGVTQKKRSVVWTPICLSVYLSVSLLGTFQGTEVTASCERCVAAVSRTFSNQRLRNYES